MNEHGRKNFHFFPMWLLLSPSAVVVQKQIMRFASTCTEEEKERKEKPYLHCCVLLCESSASGEMEAQKLYCGWLKRLVYLSSPSHGHGVRVSLGE